MDLKTRIQKNGFSIYACAKESGVPKTTLLDILSGRTSLEDCSYRTLRKLADTLGTTVDRIVDETNGLITIRPPKVVEAEPIIIRETPDMQHLHLLDTALLFGNPDDLVDQECKQAYDTGLSLFYEKADVPYDIECGVETEQVYKPHIASGSDAVLRFLEDQRIAGTLSQSQFELLGFAIPDRIVKDIMTFSISNIAINDIALTKTGVFAFKQYITDIAMLRTSGEESLSDDDLNSEKAKDLYHRLLDMCTFGSDLSMTCRPFFTSYGWSVYQISKIANNTMYNTNYIGSWNLPKRQELYPELLSRNMNNLILCDDMHLSFLHNCFALNAPIDVLATIKTTAGEKAHKIHIQEGNWSIL